MEPRQLVNARRCSADSSRTGLPCRKAAVRGLAVCRTHGGSSRSARQAAQLRLAVLVDPAIDILTKVLRPSRGEKFSPALGLAAAKVVLDRAGLKDVGSVDPLAHRIDPREFTDEQLQAILNLREQLAQGAGRQP